MKKTIISLLSLFLLVGVFAETGFQKYKWYSSPEIFPSYGQLKFEETPSSGNLWPYIYQQVIQGSSTCVYYCFSGLTDNNSSEFVAAGFLLPNKNAKEYINKKNRTLFGTLDLPYSEQNPYDNLPQEVTDFFMLSLFNEVPKIIEALGIEGAKKEVYGEVDKNAKKKSTISIYDYNDDTRLYFFENFIPGKAAILFVPHTEY